MNKEIIIVLSFFLAINKMTVYYLKINVVHRKSKEKRITLPT